MAEYTPMMKQYLKVKEQYKDSVLFYRLGDFYEMFFDDAVTASRELELVLTGRDCGQEERAPMCGVPFHAAEGYIARLVAKGYKVAICEQTEDPQTAKGLVSRDVIRIVTPGTVTESVMLDETKNNFLACVCFDGSCAGLSFCDISTGQLFVSELSGERVADRIINELARFKPSEILLNDKCAGVKDVAVYIERSCDIVASVRDGACFDLDTAEKVVTDHFKKSASDMGLGGLEGAVRSLGALLSYLYETQKNSLANITDAVIYSESRFLSLDATARRNLELTENERRREKKGSLLWVLDKTKTAPGKRKLCEWIQQPLISVSAINARLDAVEELFDNTVLRSEALERLGSINDLERIITRIVYATANAKELRTLSQTLEVLPEIKKLLSDVKSEMLNDIRNSIDTLEDIKKMIDASIVDEPPFSVREGGMIKKGCSEDHFMTLPIERAPALCIPQRRGTPCIIEQIDGTSNSGRIAHRYAVPYMWGTAGILYNKEHVSLADAQTWGTLWNNKYRGKLLMKDSYRDSYGTALIWAHRKDLEAGKTTVPQLMNDYSPEAIATVEKYLKALKPNIEGWEADFGKETMTKGKAYLNMTWSGDAVWAIEEAEKVGVKLGYEVPKEGSNVWFDGWVIPKYARNPKAAAYFINYLCQEDVALANPKPLLCLPTLMLPLCRRRTRFPSGNGV